ncbi:DEAD/DEAH box helicase [Desulfosarcina sp. OttesenSCG-928-B08]|nr:DEAD/DEAH box helicase [Desulfosarcina sp. OttesenSCG-928-B08]
MLADALSQKMIITLDRHTRIHGADPALFAFLSATFRITNPKWVENDRMGRWNRDTPQELIFYHHLKNGDICIPRGYARQLILMLRKQQAAFQVEDHRRRCPDVDFEFSATLKPFQVEAVNAMARYDSGTLSAPTGSGKTIMGLALVARRRQPALVVVHTKELAFQWVDRITAFLGIPADAVGMIGAGKNKIGEKITVALVQSLYRCADTVAPKIGQLVVDECHRAPSRTFTEAVTAFDARYLLGLSATPWRRDRLSRLIFWHLGPVHYEVSRQRLEQDGHILKADVVIRWTDFESHVDPVAEYSRMLSELAADDARNRMIAADVEKEVQAGNGVCLVLSDRKKHCETLVFILRHKFNCPAEQLTGDLSADERRQVLDRLGKGEVKVLVATGQLIGEGFDCPALSTLFLATPVRFSGRVMQYLGRILRPDSGKAGARVYDYVDGRVPPLMAAAKARQEVYGNREEIEK